MTITVEPGYGARAVIAVTPTDPAWGPWTLIRHDGTGEAPVRGVAGVTGATVAVDGEARLNTPVSYWARHDTTGETIGPATITITSRLCVLSDPISGRGVTLYIQSWPQTTPGAATAVVWPDQARYPVVAVRPERAPSTRITILTITRADETLVDELCLPGRVVLLRPACPTLPVVTAAVTGRTIDRVDDTDPTNELRLHHLELQHTAQPDPDVRAEGDTLADIHDAVPTTLDAIAARWGDLQAIAAANLKRGG